MKKTAIIITFIITLVILAFWSPWLNWNLSIGQFIGLGKVDDSAGLKVYSLLGEMDVYIDNEYKGSTSPDTDYFEILQIDPGKYNLSLKRKSNPEGAYFEFSKDITFESGIDVIVVYELGPTKRFSEGHIFYAEKSFESDSQPKINILTEPENTKIYIDDNFLGEGPLSGIDISLQKQHKIRVEKEGYDTIEFDIFPSTQDERDKLKGYELYLDINLFLIPLDIDFETENGEN